MSKALRTLLVADDGVRDRFRPLLRNHACCQVIGEVHDGEEGIHFASLCQPDLVVVGMNEESLLTVRRLHAAAPWAKLIVVDCDPDEAVRSALVQAGVHDVVSPHQEDGLARILDRLARPTLVATPSERQSGKLLACYSSKGGAGRSTLSINLAIALHRATGRETILLDGACANGELDLLLNVRPHDGLGSLLEGGRLEDALVPHPTGIQLLGWVQGDRAAKPEQLTSLLQWLKQRDCWIVVDTHPAQPELNRVILSKADRTFVPLFLDIAHVRAIQRDLADWRAAGVDTRAFELVAWNEKTEVSRQEAGNILQKPIDWTLPFEPSAVKRSVNQGIPVLQADPHGAMARDLGRICRALHEAQTTALVPFKVANPFHQLVTWLKKGPATRYGA